MAIFIGVDGGGTKTEVLVADEAGNILGSAKGGPTNPEWVGFDKAGEVLGATIDQALRMAGAESSQVAYAYLGMAGVNSDDLDNPVRTLFVKTMGESGVASELVTVDNDAFVGMASAIGPGPGIGVVAGTGFTTVGKGRDGDKHWVPWYVAGRGAGHILGQMAAKTAYFDLVGAGPKTSITGKVLETLGIRTAGDLEGWLASWKDGWQAGETALSWAE